MLCNRKNSGRIICAASYYFLTGVEYAVILPTLNGYLISLDAPNVFLGFVLASFSFTGCLSSPIFGRITDKTGSTKICIVLSNIFEIAGNFWYFAGKNFQSVLAARLISGIGSGGSASVLGMLSRMTIEKERTAVFSLVLALKQVGLLVGPAFNIFLNDLSVDIGPFTLNQYTGPGLLMASLWTLHTLITLVILKDTEKGEAIEPNQSSKLVTENGWDECSTTGNVMVKNENTSSVNTPVSAQVRRNKSFRDEFMREEIIVLLAVTFMVMFTETGVETAVTPITLLYFQWGTLYNSYLFLGIGITVILTFIITAYLSRYISDRAMLLCGCLGLFIGYAVLFSYTFALRFQNQLESPSWLLPVCMIDVAILAFGLAITFVTQSTLFSKLTSIETQAFNQGVRLAVMGLGQILGPLWAASTSTQSMLPIMSAVYLLLLSILLMMLCMSYKLLDPLTVSSNADSNTSVIDNEENENSPLLSRNT